MFNVDPTGHLQVPDTPGLGVRIDWEEVQRASQKEVVWRDEAMYLPDGTKANW
jgi:hypothetical protein